MRSNSLCTDPQITQTVQRIYDDATILLNASTPIDSTKDRYHRVCREYNDLANKIDEWDAIQFNESLDIRHSRVYGYCLSKYSDDCRDKLRLVQSHCDNFLAIARQVNSADPPVNNQPLHTTIINNGCTITDSTFTGINRSISVAVSNIDYDKLSQLIDMLDRNFTDDGQNDVLKGQLASAKAAVASKDHKSIDEIMRQIAMGVIGSGGWQLATQITSGVASALGLL